MNKGTTVIYELLFDTVVFKLSVVIRNIASANKL